MLEVHEDAPHPAWDSLFGMHCKLDMYVTEVLVMQVGGFLQRIDYVRKHAFAVMSILKNPEGQFPIRSLPTELPISSKDLCQALLPFMHYMRPRVACFWTSAL